MTQAILSPRTIAPARHRPAPAAGYFGHMAELPLINPAQRLAGAEWRPRKA